MPLPALDHLDRLLHTSRDIAALLGDLLREAMRETRAEGGTAYLRLGDRWRVAHLEHTVLLENMQSADLAMLISACMQMNPEDTIVGRVAATDTAIRIEDVRGMPADLGLNWDPMIDEALDYRTRSILATPLRDADGTVAGVLQLVNADGVNGTFSQDDEDFLTHLGRIATTGIERARLERAMLLRMIRMAELRDPTETATHVNRVAAVTVLLFERWADSTNADTTWRDGMVDELPIAAMLHDVGKVALDDAVLKKPGRLDLDERAEMETHTTKGAALFEGAATLGDRLAYDVVLHHHQRWDGNGYPAVTINGEHRPLCGDEIPLAARLVAVADVFDALASKRAYKEPWPTDRIKTVIQEGRGTHFDPDLVDLVLDQWEEVERVRAAVDA